MEPRFQITTNGQELQKDDVNLVAQEAALADDRVLAELLRLAPFDGQRVSRAIIPFGHAGASGATVSPNGPTGSVLISPFAQSSARAPRCRTAPKTHGVTFEAPSSRRVRVRSPRSSV